MNTETKFGAAADAGFGATANPLLTRAIATHMARIRMSAQ
jgi:hypothetical protein